MKDRQLFSASVVAALALSVGCSRTPPSPPTAPDAYSPAQSDYGALHRAWHHPVFGDITLEPGFKLVAADISLPPPTEGTFDLDDIDIFDAATGENFGSDPLIYRTTPDGAWVDTNDPVVKDDPNYRGVFVWAVPERVKTVNFGYWGGMLFVRPAAVESSGPQVPVSTESVVGWQALSPEGEYWRFVALLHVGQWYRNDNPRHFDLIWLAAPSKPTLCSCDRWIETDTNARPISPELLSRPYLEAHRYFLVEFWCPKRVTPDHLNRYGTHWPLPAQRDLQLSAEALAALREAPPDRHALHRLR